MTMTMTLITPQLPSSLEIAEQVTSKYGMNVVAMPSTRVQGTNYVTTVKIYNA